MYDEFVHAITKDGLLFEQGECVKNDTRELKEKRKTSILMVSECELDLSVQDNDDESSDAECDSEGVAWSYISLKGVTNVWSLKGVLMIKLQK